MSPETKTKISLSMKGNKNRLGYKSTEKQSRNMSRAIKKWHRERKDNETMQGLQVGILRKEEMAMQRALEGLSL